MKQTPNNLAFPLKVGKKHINGVAVEYDVHPGLTKREHFAGLALQGILSTESCYGLQDRYKAEYAVIMADHLIQELNKEPKP